MSNSFHKSLADKFNKKKTLHNDISRISKFNLHKINKNITTYIHMDIFASNIVNDIVNDIDINRLKNKKVKKIYHVYQEKYINGSNATGLGDFIRSCFFIIQFCNNFNFDYEIIINHPIASFLENCNSKIPNNLLRNYVTMFSDTNWTKTIFNKKNNIEQFILSKQKYNLFINYLCSLPVINNSIFSYNIFFPTNDITIDQADKIKELFKPSSEIIEYVDETLANIELDKNKFIALHIRSGDSYLKGENKIFSSLNFEIIKNEIIEIMFNNKNIPVLLIADNNEIKYLLRDEFPHFKLYFKDITHVGEGVELERAKVKNTLLDFYLMSYSRCIYSFTAYPHGSGFSYWCSKLYNIPYYCKFIKC